MMKNFLLTLMLILGFAGAAQADIWKWMDAENKVHFVDSKSPIFTWTDERGRVHYADTPGHEDAVAVELVWVSTGDLDDVTENSDASGSSESGGYAYPGETPAERAEREKAEAYYCKRATEVYDSYVKAPKLYDTNAEGERAYLSEKDAEKLIAETRSRVDEYCK